MSRLKPPRAHHHRAHAQTRSPRALWSHRLAARAGACRTPRRNNCAIRTAPPIPPPGLAATSPAPISFAAGASRQEIVSRGLGTLGLLGVVASVLWISAGAASAPSLYVPARSGGWSSWLAGPLAGLDLGLDKGSFQALTLIMCAGYALVLTTTRSLSMRALAGATVAAHVILLLGPPLISQDVFGYLGFARMGVLHGLDPYTRVAAEAPADPVFLYLGWPFQHSPYGPLFTLASYATAPLGLAGALWTLKAVAVAASLGAVALVGAAARALGHDARRAVAFVGLNPVLLELAVGGAHNDTLIMLTLAAALMLTATPRRSLAASAPPRARARPRHGAAALALAAGVGVKVTAGVTLPFLVLAPARAHERARTAAFAVAGLALVAAVGVAGFGVHALGFLNAVGEQQQLVAVHSIPAETARLAGLSGTPTWWRQLFVGAFALAFVLALWRAERGADWRVSAGWAMLALLVCTAWLLPWYAIWTLPLAAVSADRRLRGATLVVCAYAILIHLPLADPLLSPGKAHVAPARAHAVAHRR
jgi:Glycosyltransferase family 87